MNKTSTSEPKLTQSILMTMALDRYRPRQMYPLKRSRFKQKLIKTSRRGRWRSKKAKKKERADKK